MYKKIIAMQTQQEPLTDTQYSFILDIIGGDTRKLKYDLRCLLNHI